MPDDLADDLQSLSFGSSGRSAATTDTTTTASSYSSSGSAPTSGHISATAASANSSEGHANGHSSSACCCSNSANPDLETGQAIPASSSSSSPPLRMSDLRFLRRLGSGDIGTVYLAQLVADGASTGLPCRHCGGTTAKPKQQQQQEARLLAAKVMDKEELRGRNKQGRAKAELEILKMLDHPFLPKLVASVQDDRWACLLTDFCPGGDLHVLRQRQPYKRFPEAAVRFYAAEVVVAMEYLHMLGVVYRDLKPENVLVRADGHIMLTDFDLSLRCDESDSTPRLLGLHCASSRDSGGGAGMQTAPGMLNGGGITASCILPSCIVPAVSCFNTSKKNIYKKSTTASTMMMSCAADSHKAVPGVFSTKRGNRKGGCTADQLEFVAEPVGTRSMSFVGTHEYLAPEIVSGEGHGSAVDWWTLGVLLFELLYGYTPFRGPDNDMTLANIVARALEFPKDSGSGGSGRADWKGRRSSILLNGGREYCSGPPVVSQQAKDLIAGLLVKDPGRRLGSATGAAAVKRHPFFHGVNWALLRCAKPPLVPPPIPRSFFVVDHAGSTNPNGIGMLLVKDGGDDDNASCDGDAEDDGDENREEDYTSSSTAGSVLVNRCSSSSCRVGNNNNNADATATATATATAKHNTANGGSGSVETVVLPTTVDGNSPPGSPVEYY